MIGVSVCLSPQLRRDIDILNYSGRYEYSSSFAIWPQEGRPDLKTGVRARQQGNLALSRKLIAQCVFQGVPITLKLSGTAIMLGEVLKEDNQPNKGYETYLAALEHLRRHWSALTNEEKLRAISIGQKLG